MISLLVFLIFLKLSEKATTSALNSTNSTATTEMHVCVILERNSRTIIANYDKLAAVIDLAIIYVQQEVLQETGIILRQLFRDGGQDCASNHFASTAAMQLFYERYRCDAYLGPGCAAAAAQIINIASYTRAPVFAIPAGGITSSTVPRSLFPQMIRLSYHMTNFALTIVGILKHLSFIHTYVLVESSVMFCQAVSDALYDTFRKSQPEMLRLSQFVYMDGNQTEDNYRQYVQNAEKYARALILLTSGLVTRHLMLLAKDFGMTEGDYVYIAVEPFESESWGILSTKGTDGRDSDADDAFNSMLLVALSDSFTPYYAQFGATFLTRAQDKYHYDFANDGNVSSHINPLVTAYFDAMVLYGNALRTVYKAGQSVRNPLLVIEAMRNKVYYSPVTEAITTDSNCDRLITYTVLDYVDGLYDDVMTFRVPADGLLYQSNITWPNNRQPIDTPFCGFLGTSPRCQKRDATGPIIGVVFAIVFLIGAVVGGKVYRKRKKMDDPYWWRYSMEELDFLTEQPLLRSKESHESDQEETDSSPPPYEQVRKHVGHAELHGIHVGVIQLPERLYLPTAWLLAELNMIRALHHQNLVHIVGLCLNGQGFCSYLLEDACEKGSLADLMGGGVSLDNVFKHSFLHDIVEAMVYLHSSAIGSHGFLSSACCCVNSKFTVKLDDYGITQFRDSIDLLPPKTSDPADKAFDIYLWRAPELLRETMPVTGTKKGDVYSVSIITQEVICETAPFLLPVPLRDVEKSIVRDHVLEVKRGTMPPHRPKVPAKACLPHTYEIMEMCWSEEPEDRPSFQYIQEFITKHKKTGAGHSIIDHLLQRMEDYSKELEAEVERKTEQFRAEKTRSDNLLKNMLPKSIAESLTKGQTVSPESFSSVTIFFSDIIGFSELCSRISPVAVLEALNCLYLWSDAIMEEYDIYKVEAIDDIFMVASGLPIRNGMAHVTIMASLALHLRREVPFIRIPNQSRLDLKIRIGIFSGPCVAGIVGLKMPRYCLFGDSVNTASRMQSHGEADKIHLSESSAQLLREIGGFLVEERGEMHIKGKGMMTTYWLTGTKETI